MAKRSVGVYKVLNSNDLTLLVYRHYLSFILDLRRMKNVPVYISNHDSFLLDTDRPPAAFYFPIHAKCFFFSSWLMPCTYLYGCVSLLVCECDKFLCKCECDIKSEHPQKPHQ